MKHPLQAASRFLWVLTFLCCTAFYAFWGKDAYSFYGDALGYYMYLPSTFIYHNHKQVEKLPADRGIRPFILRCAAGTGEGRRSPKGYVVYQYTYGVALMEAPAFFAAHLWELARGGLANGFSGSYQTAVGLLTLLYGLAGLLLVYRFLRRRFEAPVASIATALLLLGTNLFWFVLQQQGMAHVPLFFLFAVLLYLTDRVQQRAPAAGVAAALGFTAGLITLIRPIDGLCVLIPLLYGLGTKDAAGRRALLRAKRSWVGWAAVAFVLPLIPQLLYWKWLTGSFLYDSYGPGQTLDLLHSHLRRGLFGASNGWLLYTPLMGCALFGLLWYRRLDGYRIAIPVFLLLYIWCVYAWFSPSYPNGLGSRPMVDVYAVLAVPLAAFLERVGRSRRLVQATAALVLLLFTALNLSYTVQEAEGILWSENSNYAYNRQTMFRYTTRPDDLIVWDTGVPQPDTGRLRALPLVAQASVRDSSLSAHVILDTEGRRVYRMDAEFSPVLVSVAADSVLAQGARWIRCAGRLKLLEPEHDIYKNQLLVLEVRRGEGNIAWHGIRVNNKVGLAEQPDLKPEVFTFRSGFWGTVSAFVPVPKDLQKGDQIRFFVANTAQKPVLIDCLQLSFFR